MIILALLRLFNSCTGIIPSLYIEVLRSSKFALKFNGILKQVKAFLSFLEFWKAYAILLEPFLSKFSDFGDTLAEIPDCLHVLRSPTNHG